jgi:hypothetical protein
MLHNKTYSLFNIYKRYYPVLMSLQIIEDPFSALEKKRVTRPHWFETCARFVRALYYQLMIRGEDQHE